MTRAELKTALKRYGFDDDDPLDIWINAARNELVSDLPFPVMDAEASFVTVAGDGNLSDNLPADFLKVIALTDDTDVGDSGSLDYMDYRMFRREIPDRSTQGQPTIFTVRNLNNITVYPVPDRTTTWDLLYQKSVTQLTDDSHVPSELPVQFHYPIVPRAAAIGLSAENEEERSEKALNDYLTGKQTIITFFSTRQGGQFESVQDVMNYASN